MDFVDIPDPCVEGVVGDEVATSICVDLLTNIKRYVSEVVLFVSMGSVVVDVYPSSVRQALCDFARNQPQRDLGTY